MKPNEKGWLKEYLEFRQELLKDLASEGRRAAHPEHSLYRIIQPMGLMYGQSVDVFEHPNNYSSFAKGRVKTNLDPFSGAAKDSTQIFPPCP